MILIMLIVLITLTLLFRRQRMNRDDEFLNLLLTLEGSKIVIEPSGVRSRYGLREDTLRAMNITTPLEEITPETAKDYIMRYFDFMKVPARILHSKDPKKYVLLDFVYHAGMNKLAKSFIKDFDELSAEIMTAKRLAYYHQLAKRKHEFKKFLQGWKKRAKLILDFVKRQTN